MSYSIYGFHLKYLNLYGIVLPVLDCVEWLCTVHVYRGMKRVLCYLKVFKRRIKEAQLLRNVPSNSYLQAGPKGKSLTLVTQAH